MADQLSFTHFSPNDYKAGKNILCVIPDMSVESAYCESIVETLRQSESVVDSDVYWIANEKPQLNDGYYHIQNLDQYKNYVENYEGDEPRTLVYFYPPRDVLERIRKGAKFAGLMENPLTNVIVVLESHAELHHLLYKYFNFLCVYHGDTMDKLDKKSFFRYFFNFISSSRILDIFLAYTQPLVIVTNKKTTSLDDKIFQLHVKENLTPTHHTEEDVQSISDLLPTETTDAQVSEDEVDVTYENYVSGDGNHQPGSSLEDSRPQRNEIIESENAKSDESTAVEETEAETEETIVEDDESEESETEEEVVEESSDDITQSGGKTRKYQTVPRARRRTTGRRVRVPSTKPSSSKKKENDDDNMVECTIM